MPAIGAQDLVIEIGPGIGVLTWEAAQLAQKVIAVEIDKNLIPILAETLREADNIEVINQDILKTDINTLIEREKAEAGSRRAGRMRMCASSAICRTISPHRSS